MDVQTQVKEPAVAQTWTDITDLCRRAAAEMTNLAPMVHTEEFSLLDSMSAVEIMDPIMDQCCGLKGSLKEEDLFNVAYPTEGIPLTTVVKLFQSLFIYEAAFLDGASLMESINKCIFSWEGSWSGLEKRAALLGSAGLADRAVLAYCKSLVFTTGCQFKAVLAADIYEDEDFQPGYKNFLFDKTLETVNILAALESVIVELEEVDSGDNTVQYLLQILKTRLQLHNFHYSVGFWIHSTIQEYSRLLKQRRAEDPSSASEAGANPAEMALTQLLLSARKRSKLGCAKIKTLSAQTAASLQSLIDLHKTGGAGAGIYEDIPHPTTCTEISFALSNNIVKLHQTGPIRRVAMKPYLASVAYVQSICTELVDISTTVASFFAAPIASTVEEARAVRATNESNGNLHRELLTLDTVLHNTLHLSAANLHLLTRCYYTAVLYVLSPDMTSLIWASMYTHGLPRALLESEVVTKHWIAANLCVVAWDTLKGLVVCRSRLFASRLQNIMDLWNNVANESLFIDSNFHRDLHGPEAAAETPQHQWSSLWALQQLVYMMDLYMSLVVEMDLVGVEEWDYFYWYWDYICNSGSYAAEKLRTQSHQLAMQMHGSACADLAKLTLTDEADGVGGKKANKKKKKPAAAAPTQPLPPMPPLPALKPPTTEEVLLKGRGLLCRGVYRMCALAGPAPMGIGLTKRGEPLINKAEGRYSTWDTKFAHRFQAFSELQNPGALSYTDYLQATGRTAASVANGAAKGQAALTGAKRDVAVLNNLTQGAQLCFQHARKLFDEAKSDAKNADNKYVNATITTLTKASVASALSTMRVAQLLKEPLTTTTSASATTVVSVKSTDNNKCYALGVNRTYNKHFAVLDFSVDATA